jgi:hypothetical protein
LIYHGTNDLTQISRELAHAAGLVDTLSAEEGFLARHSVAWNLLSKNLLYALRASGGTGKLDVDGATLAAPFHERLDRLVTAAQRTAGVVVLVTFSHRQRRGQTPEELRLASGSSLYYMPWLSPETILAGFEALNEAVRDVARERGAVLVEGDAAVPADDVHFADSVHFYDPGEERQAQRVLAGLRASPALQALLATCETPR